MALLSRRDPERAQVRAARRDAVRSRLMAATEDLLRDGSTYADLRVESIAAHAGISRTTFYDYFPDKRELLLSFTREILRDALSETDEWRPGEDHDQTKAELRKIIMAFVHVYAHPAVRAIVEATYYDAEVSAAWMASQERHIERAVRLLEAERAAGRFQEHESTLPARARALHWGIHATILREISLRQEIDRDELVDALVDISLLGVRGVLP